MEQKDNQFIVTMTAKELISLIENSVLNAIKEYEQKNTAPPEEPELMPRKKVAALFNVSLVSLDKWRRKGLLPKPIKQGSRVYYLKEEIMQLINNKKYKS